MTDGELGFTLMYEFNNNTDMNHPMFQPDGNGHVSLMHFLLAPCSTDNLERAVRQAIADATISPVSAKIMCFRFPAGKLVLFTNGCCMREGENRQRFKQHMTSREELSELLWETFGDSVDSREEMERAIDVAVEIAPEPPWKTEAAISPLKLTEPESD